MKLLFSNKKKRTIKFIVISILMLIISGCTTLDFSKSDSDVNPSGDDKFPDLFQKRDEDMEDKDKEPGEKKEDKKESEKKEKEEPEYESVVLNIDFDNNLPASITGNEFRYTKDALFGKWYDNKTRASGVLKDVHGNVCELNGRAKEDAYISTYVEVLEPSVLTFEKKSDLYSSDVLQVAIDADVYKIYHKGYGEDWETVQFKLKPGYHKITISLPVQKVYSAQLLNVMYIDNITVARDEVDHVEIYPKGLQETFERGIPIKFYGKAYRGDNTVMSGKNVRFFTSGCGTIDSAGVFRPSSKGTCTITAIIDGKTAQNTDVKVYDNFYYQNPVTIGSAVFTGKIRSVAGESLDTDNTKYYSPTPLGTSFSTDGFFILNGKTAVPLYLLVSKNGTDLKTYYTIRNKGSFTKRIWLRFGEGDYTVKIIEPINMQFNDTGDERYEGALKSLGEGYVKKVLNVRNTNPMTEEDAIWLMPSEFIQSDSFYVSNVANSILSKLPRNASTGDKIRETHNWILNNTHYDNISVNHVEKRKKQDAESVLLYKMGVCEGYSNLFAAILRKMGIKTIYIGDDDLNHAWNHVKYNDKIYLVDVTWDDPVLDKSDDYNDFATGKENYTYFMTALTDEKHKNEVDYDAVWQF